MKYHIDPEEGSESHGVKSLDYQWSGSAFSALAQEDKTLIQGMGPRVVPGIWGGFCNYLFIFMFTLIFIVYYIQF